ncbi:hypothetical protein [Rubellicoccus peritrichatus]|uniref:Alkaline shock response membrane anchor protein AmaP n=1 Tax=Rubellicoccus peritrichatus TaxID=3080537 RepID=A0AAQ3LAJ9_9BACT|nr:hypothetical protein [Puniceicoccus sp. CR14]WOO41906.1 hypothetical protein RZN69_02315 [Puniceicoccus sp. CR14]
MNFYHEYISHIVSEPWFYWCLGGVGVFFILFIVATCFRGRSIRVFRDESGHASISRKALKDLVHIACSRIGTPTKPKIEFTPKRGRLDLNVQVKLYEGQRLNEIRDQLRRSVIRTFEETHGIRLGDINVVVTGFKKGGPGAPPSDPELEITSSEPVSGVSVFTEPESSEPKVTHALEEADTVSDLESEATTSKADDDKSFDGGEDASADEDSDTTPPAKKRSFFAWGKKSKSEDEIVSDDAIDDVTDSDTSDDGVAEKDPSDETKDSEDGLLSSDSDKKD